MEKFLDSLKYGVIGNGASAALISQEGQLNWCCLSAFDSTSIFAALLDTERGGHFGIRLDDQLSMKQVYIPQTNILSTTLYGESGSLEILDFMPRYRNRDESPLCPPEIIRILRVQKRHTIPASSEPTRVDEQVLQLF